MQQIKPAKSHPFFLKLSIIIIIVYLTVVTISLAVTGFLFFTLDYYKPRIEKIIYTRTGYRLNLGRIQTTFNNRWLPQIILNDLSLSGKHNPNEFFKVKSIKLVISYASIWNLMPIFDTIAIDDTILTLTRTAKDEFLLNGFPFPENKLTQLRPNTLDTQDWALKKLSY